MPNKRLPMRKIKEILRLKYVCGLSERLTDPGHGGLSHADFIGLLVQDEKDIP